MIWREDQGAKELIKTFKDLRFDANSTQTNAIPSKIEKKSKLPFWKKKKKEKKKKIKDTSVVDHVENIEEIWAKVKIGRKWHVVQTIRMHQISGITFYPESVKNEEGQYIRSRKEYSGWMRYTKNGVDKKDVAMKFFQKNKSLKGKIWSREEKVREVALALFPLLVCGCDEIVFLRHKTPSEPRKVAENDLDELLEELQNLRDLVEQQPDIGRDLSGMDALELLLEDLDSQC